MNCARLAQHTSHRVVRRLLASVLGVALMCASTPSQAFAPDSNEIERLYLEGQQRMEDSDYHGAADSWTRLLGLLPESKDNQATRESIIISILDAHLRAYNGLVDESGTKDITHLHNGKRTLDRYYADFKAVHGDRVAVSSAVQEQAEALDRTLARAEQELKGSPAIAVNSDDPVVNPPPPAPQPPTTVIISQNNGVGLLVGGSVVAALGLGAVAMIPIGIGRVNRSVVNYESATDSTARQRAEFEGNQGEDVWIAGAVLAPIILAAGAVMIVFGVKTRKQWKDQQQRLSKPVSAVPVFHRDYAGLSFQGRF